VRNSESLKQSQAELTEIDLIVAGQFQRFGDGERVTYTDSIVDSGQGRSLQQVFIAIQGSDEGEGQRIVVAESARPELDDSSGARFMRLNSVLQYEGVPGRADFTVGQFDVQAMRLPDPQPFTLAAEEVEMLPTNELLGSDDPASIAELQWRLSMILLVPVVAFVAVPLSRVQPRQGRYSKLLPAAILYAAYFVLLQLSRDRVSEGDLAPLPGLWWVHLLVVAAGALAFAWPAISNRIAAGVSPGANNSR
jgi:lipopolysaccharide export system permease protein